MAARPHARGRRRLDFLPPGRPGTVARSTTVCYNAFSAVGGLTEPAMSALHVLLITNRPAVHAFLEEHGARSIPRITATQLPLCTEGLDQHHRDVHDAQVAMIDVGADPDADHGD